MICSKTKLKRQEARLLIRQNKRTRQSWRKECRIYFCEEHQAWHVTSMESNAKIKNAKNLKYKKKWLKLVVKI